MSEKTLSEMNTGRMGQVALNHIEPVLEKLRLRHLSGLKNLHRAGKFDPAMAQSHIAALCDLDDLESELKRQVATGERATATNHGKGLTNVETDTA